MDRFVILPGCCTTSLKTVCDSSINCCITSPPYYGLRNYGVDGQIGLEESPEKYISSLVEVFREVRRVLRDDGTLWLNLGDSYATQPGQGDNVPQTKWAKNNYPESAAHRSLDCGVKPKNLLGIPWRVALALQADGWYLRQDIIWHKPNTMPESVTDRCTKSHEYIFLLSKSEKYYFDNVTIKEDATGGYNGSKFNTGKTFVHQDSRNSKRDRSETNKRNKRSVWTVSTAPYKGAHFATFPP